MRVLDARLSITKRPLVSSKKPGTDHISTPSFQQMNKAAPDFSKRHLLCAGLLLPAGQGQLRGHERASHLRSPTLLSPQESHRSRDLRANVGAESIDGSAKISCRRLFVHVCRSNTLQSEPAADQCPSAVNRICLHVTGNQLHKYTHACGHAHHTEAFKEADGNSLIAPWW